MQGRDLSGQWAAGTAAGNAGGGTAADPKSADWGPTRDALMKHATPTAHAGSLPGTGFVAQPPDFSAAFRAMGYTGGEGPGQHQVQTDEGPARHGSDVPGTGVPGTEGAPEAGTAGAEAGGAAAGGAELGEVALLAL